MAWTTPKTNWKATDYFNYSDYNRIVGNLNYLKIMADELFMEVDYESMATGKTYESYFYASEMNAIENNLESLNLASYNLDIGIKTTYKINGSTPLYSEFNRIESACLRFYNTFIVHKENLPHLAIRLGNARTFCVART